VKSFNKDTATSIVISSPLSSTSVNSVQALSLVISGIAELGGSVQITIVD
jgi:hypothetical protein